MMYNKEREMMYNKVRASKDKPWIAVKSDIDQDDITILGSYCDRQGAVQCIKQDKANLTAFDYPEEIWYAILYINTLYELESNPSLNEVHAL